MRHAQTGLLRRPGLALAVVPAVFTLAWSGQAISDDSGLWVLGAVMVLVATLARVATVAYCADAGVSRAGRPGPLAPERA